MRWTGVSPSMVVVPYKPEHVGRGASVPVGACLPGHSPLFPNVGECPRTALRPEISVPTSAQGAQVAATEEPKAPRLAVSVPAPAPALRGQPGEPGGVVARPPDRSSWAPPGPAPGGGGRGEGRGGAGRGGGLAPLERPVSHWRKVPARHLGGSSSKVLCT